MIAKMVLRWYDGGRLFRLTITTIERLLGQTTVSSTLPTTQYYYNYHLSMGLLFTTKQSRNAEVL
jgi:hypothetical protein